MDSVRAGWDFDEALDRRGTDCVKWDVCAAGELPMWVADMDFACPPAVRKAVEDRAAQGVFGYALIPDAWYDAYIGWWKDRHDFAMEREWLAFSTGVVPIISSVVRKLTSPAEGVLLQTPVYNVFYNCILNNGRRVVESPLTYRDGRYEVDFADLEEKLSDPQTTLMILCNPANPVGAIWDADTLRRIGELCWEHHVTVVSDEIHCDLTDPGCSYVPFASVSQHCRDNSVTCLAPTKTFNIAGIQTAAVCVPEPHLRARVVRALNTDEVAEANVFAPVAAIAAFTECGPWLDDLREYIAQNKRLVRERLNDEALGISVVASEATYLLWLDCAGMCDDTDRFAAFLREHSGLVLSKGSQYGPQGRTFLRMNVACPRSLVEDGLNRFVRAAREYVR